MDTIQTIFITILVVVFIYLFIGIVIGWIQYRKTKKQIIASELVLFAIKWPWFVVRKVKKNSRYN